MLTALSLMLVQGALGAFDTLWHHEITERLTWRPAAARELRLHALRNMLYAPVFLGLAWAEWHGAFAWLLVAILAIEVVTTLADFVLEDRTRLLPASERITHTLLAVNYGAILACMAPELMAWAGQPSGLAATQYGPVSWGLSLFGAGVAVWGWRDGTRAVRLARAARRAPRPGDLVAALRRPHAVLVAGGTGFIGSRLVEALADAGHRVTVLTRDRRRSAFMPAGVRVVDDLAQLGTAARFDAVVNLAGEPVASGRWTAAKRRRIVESRLSATRALIAFIAFAETRPGVLISGSAIGWYGCDEEAAFTENSAPAADPGVAHALCVPCEAAALAAERLGPRVCLLRTGLVLDASGGALGRLLLPFEFGLGGRIGDGRQWMSWIHRDDMVGLIAHAIADTRPRGPLNATAPTPVRNAEFAAALGRALGRPAVLPLPALPLRLALGTMAEELLIGGQRVLPRKALAAGYAFRYPTIDGALAAIVGAGTARYAARRHGGETARCSSASISAPRR